MLRSDFFPYLLHHRYPQFHLFHVSVLHLIFVLFVHQCNIHFLFFIIRRHVSASYGHLQVL
jgi:hypothetical protein